MIDKVLWPEQHGIWNNTESFDMTPQEISDYKMKWKPGYSVPVHSDLHTECKTWCRKNLPRERWSMDTYTDVYEHTFMFELESDAELFADEFKEWIQNS